MAPCVVLLALRVKPNRRGSLRLRRGREVYS